jgi:hypothetical protein
MRRIQPLIIAALAACAAVPALAQRSDVGLIWQGGTVNSVVVADVSDSPGLESIVSDDSGWALYSLGTGTLLETLPAPFAGPAGPGGDELLSARPRRRRQGGDHLHG